MLVFQALYCGKAHSGAVTLQNGDSDETPVEVMTGHDAIISAGAELSIDLADKSNPSTSPDLTGLHQLW